MNISRLFMSILAMSATFSLLQANAEDAKPENIRSIRPYARLQLPLTTIGFDYQNRDLDQDPINTSIFGKVAVGVDIGKRWGAEISTGLSLAQWAVHAKARYYLMDSTLRPFAIAGIAYHWSDGFLSNVKYAGFGISGGLGFRWELGKHFSLTNQVYAEVVFVDGKGTRSGGQARTNQTRVVPTIEFLGAEFRF